MTTPWIRQVVITAIVAIYVPYSVRAQEPIDFNAFKAFRVTCNNATVTFADRIKASGSRDERSNVMETEVYIDMQTRKVSMTSAFDWHSSTENLLITDMQFSSISFRSNNPPDGKHYESWGAGVWDYNILNFNGADKGPLDESQYSIHAEDCSVVGWPK